MIAPMDRPAITKDECLELDELIGTTIVDWSIPQHLLQFHQRCQPARQIKETVAVVSPFLMDPILILREFNPRSVAEDLHPIFWQAIMPTNLLVKRGVKNVGR